ncbi:Uncharacterized protein APZ42_016842 [Daphnia magna]|uniref:Uncharacterized protein n=1 Tax=Daphnia magna TaxID=35525 RepID=A0A165A7C2_9CRUS|nr:Uncharacterized protein APZ42_016842 [Daphnia magna]
MFRCITRFDFYIISQLHLQSLPLANNFSFFSFPEEKQNKNELCLLIFFAGRNAGPDA